MNRIVRVSAILMATVALSGCASIFGSTFAFAGSRAPRSAPARPAAENVDLALARTFMAAGKTAEAIDHFRAAQMDPAALPAASNGLGVAYARLGRLDLADRYFRVALALEPANERYAANMLRLQRDYAVAQARTEATTRLAEAARAEAARLAAAERPGAIERISRGEVHIVTAPVGNGAPLAEVASRDAAAPPSAAKPASADEPAKASAQYPVRIDLSKVVLVD